MSLDGPEVHAHHHHHGGLPRWAEIALSGSALIVSLSSIAIAIHHGQIMDKLVKANSFPYLIGVFSDANETGGETLSVDFSNNGIGPADEQSLKIKVGDKYVTSVPDLIATVVGPQEAPAAVAALSGLHNTVHTRFIAGHGSQFVFRINKTPQNASYWDKVDQSQRSWRIEYCYCSVFDECWAVKNEAHKPIKQCVRDEPHEFLP